MKRSLTPSMNYNQISAGWSDFAEAIDSKVRSTSNRRKAGRGPSTAGSDPRQTQCRRLQLLNSAANCSRTFPLFSSRPFPFVAQNVGGVGDDSFGGFSGGSGGGGNAGGAGGSSKTDASGGGGGRGGRGREFSGRNGLRGWDLEPPDSVLGGFSTLTGGGEGGGYHSGVLKHARSAGSLATAGEGAGEALKQGLPRRASGIRQLAATATAVAAEGRGSSGGGERKQKHKQRQRN